MLKARPSHLILAALLVVAAGAGEALAKKGRGRRGGGGAVNGPQQYEAKPTQEKVKTESSTASKDALKDAITLNITYKQPLADMATAEKKVDEQKKLIESIADKQKISVLKYVSSSYEVTPTPKDNLPEGAPAPASLTVIVKSTYIMTNKEQAFALAEQLAKQNMEVAVHTSASTSKSTSTGTASK